LIYVDAGNTAIKIKHNNKVFRFDQNPEAQLIKYLNSHVQFSYIISSVRGQDFKNKIKQTAVNQGVWVEVTQTFNDTINAYGAGYSALGVDRWVCLIGAKSMYPNKSLCVIDSGTAITIDVLSKEGVHQGGHIVPGLWSLYSALQSNTANITTNKIRQTVLKDHGAFGSSTNDGIVKGCRTMIRSYIDKIAKDLIAEFESITFVVTGGGKLDMQNIEHHEHPELIFEGLEVIMRHRESEKG
jgi:type III pantothenate kinase